MTEARKENVLLALTLDEAAFFSLVMSRTRVSREVMDSKFGPVVDTLAAKLELAIQDRWSVNAPPVNEPPNSVQ